MQNDLQNGLVVRVTGGEFRVDIGGQTVSCHLRGKVRRKGYAGIVAGDRVCVEVPEREDGFATIESVSERTSWLARYIEREARERVIVANIARLFVVAAIKSPPVHTDFIDRVLVSAEYGSVSACLILNKIDLSTPDEVNEVASVYRECGYEVLTTDALTGNGVSEVVEMLGKGVYAFVGESGVGKSSLLMSIDPLLEIRVREIGEKTGRGRHTTTTSELYAFKDGFLADTPGVQTFGFAGEDKLRLPDCFSEFRAHTECRFSPCVHSHEPGCAVKGAVEAGMISRRRYDSYLKILTEVEERAKRKRW